MAQTLTGPHAGTTRATAQPPAANRSAALGPGSNGTVAAEMIVKVGGHNA